MKKVRMPKPKCRDARTCV